jgi:hypothetical protein
MSKNYITITSLLSERIGSQMNNFAMLFLIALKTGHTVGIYDSYLTKGHGQKLITETFNIPIEIISDDCASNTSSLHWDITSNINLPKQDNIFDIDSNISYNISEGLIHWNYLYFLDTQSLNYIKQHIFSFKDEIKNRGQAYFNTIKSPNKKVVSIHVRRTDHCTLSPEYQREAIRLFNPEEYSVLVLSDDINFCRSEFMSDLKDYDVVFSEHTFCIDMYLMTLCDANIIADSTFCFWGSLLNNFEREMIMPRSILPSNMDVDAVLQPLKKFTTLKW